MNTERPDNDDAARGPEDGTTPEKTGPVDEGVVKDADEGAVTDADDGTAKNADENADDSLAKDADGDAVEDTAKAAAEPEATAEPDAPAAPAPEAEAPAAAAAEEPGGEPAVEAPRAASEPDEPPAAPGEDVSVGNVFGGEADEPRRRRSPAVVAAVAAAVLLVGGGGAYLAASAGGGGGGESGAGAPSKDGTPPALVLDDHSVATNPSEGGSDSGGNGIAPGEPNPYGVVYRAAGALPAGPDSAPVYWAKGGVVEAEVARLAAALGVEGTPVTEGQSWKVGAGTDGSGPVLRVEKQAPGLWSFSRYAVGTDACEGGAAVCTQGSTAGAPVSEEAAKKAAAPVLKAVGQDEAKVDASQVVGGQRMVNADAAFGGLPTYGWTTGVTVSGQGEVVAGNGQLKAPAEGDSYPVLSAQETLDRMNAAPGADHRMGIGGCATSAPLDGRPDGKQDRLESPCAPSTAVPQKQTLTVEDAVFGLAPHSSGGRQVLVPSWLFEVRGAGDGAYTVTHPAVEPEFLSAPPTATPSDAPTSDAKTHDVKVDGYTAEGRELTVSFTGGVCSDYAAKATESGGQVKVTVTATPWPDKVCIKIAKVFQKTVQLDEPLGGRTVVGSDGKEIPLEKPGARLP